MSDDDIDNEGLEDDLEGEDDGEELAAAPDDEVSDVEDSPEALVTPTKGKAKAEVSIDDLIAMLDLVALHGQPGAIYNVADDEPARAAVLYGEVRRRLGMVPPRS